MIMPHSHSQPVLGLQANAGAFAALVLINAFVGVMVGLERVVLPVLSQSRWGVESYAAVLSFIVTFGLAKALANILAGGRAGRARRHNHRRPGWGRAPAARSSSSWAGCSDCPFRSCSTGRPSGPGWWLPTPCSG
jgi:hypothetical protein